jgi:hypothetical protein
MTSLTRSLAGAVLATATTSAIAAWEVYDLGIAFQPLPYDMAVSVTYFDTQQCQQAYLVIHGNPDIETVTLVIDGQNLGTAATQIHRDYLAIVKLTEHGVKRMKAGRTAMAITEEGILEIDLNGSKDAIEAARAACLDRLKRPVQATTFGPSPL